MTLIRRREFIPRLSMNMDSRDEKDSEVMKSKPKNKKRKTMMAMSIKSTRRSSLQNANEDGTHERTVSAIKKEKLVTFYQLYSLF